MKYLPREVADAKLRAMVEGARIVREELRLTAIEHQSGGTSYEQRTNGYSCSRAWRRSAVPRAGACTRRRSLRATSLEEVVVTARKRDEASLDVPVAVNAFTAAEIESAGIERPQDFIALTPNMTMVQTQNQGTSFITVRGISQARNSEPSVAVLIDGVALANPSQFNQELFDIESIEVLKGPQGALYGRNAIGGAIIITHAAADRRVRGQGSRRATTPVPATRCARGVSGPMQPDTLKFAASASYFDTDGYIDNTFLRRRGRSVQGPVRRACSCCGSRATSFTRRPARVRLATSTRRRCTSTSPRA